MGEGGGGRRGAARLRGAGVAFQTSGLISPFNLWAFVKTKFLGKSIIRAKETERDVYTVEREREGDENCF